MISLQCAKWWAAVAGSRVVHTAQHLHGGIGSDLDGVNTQTAREALTLAATTLYLTEDLSRAIAVLVVAIDFNDGADPEIGMTDKSSDEGMAAALDPRAAGSSRL